MWNGWTTTSSVHGHFLICPNSHFRLLSPVMSTLTRYRRAASVPSLSLGSMLTRSVFLELCWLLDGRWRARGTGVNCMLRAQLLPSILTVCSWSCWAQHDGWWFPPSPSSYAILVPVREEGNSLVPGPSSREGQRPIASCCLPFKWSS